MAKVSKNIAAIYGRKRAALYALALEFAALAINYFRQQQNNNAYWNNETNQAKDLVFSKAFVEDVVNIGWLIAHGVEYGPYLELANNGRNQALRPIIQRFAGRFFKRAKELYSD